MIGGMVIEVVDLKDMVYVNVADRPCGKVEECAIYVERNSDSERIEIGDSIWWQGNRAMWTPYSAKKSRHHGDLICGRDYDIQIPRIGYSGVSHPFRKA